MARLKLAPFLIRWFYPFRLLRDLCAFAVSIALMDLATFLIQLLNAVQYGLLLFLSRAG